MPSTTRTSAPSRNPTQPQPHLVESVAPASRQRVSALEQTYGQFYPSTIEKAERSSNGASVLMSDLNQIAQIMAGLGAVLRIVGGNQVLADEFDPDNPSSPPPLSKAAEYMLTAMAAAVCEQMRDDIERRADAFNTQVQS